MLARVCIDGGTRVAAFVRERQPARQVGGDIVTGLLEEENSGRDERDDALTTPVARMPDSPPAQSLTVRWLSALFQAWRGGLFVLLVADPDPYRPSRIAIRTLR